MAAIDFTEGELAEFLTMPPPIKGKPTAEQKEGLRKRKAFLAAVAKRVGQSSKAVQKALSAAASEALESGPLWMAMPPAPPGECAARSPDALALWAAGPRPGPWPHKRHAACLVDDQLVDVQRTDALS
eukprot:COSAG01_NODE_561_length_15460_cov_95.444307_6_plen_128_part_00